MTVFKGWYVLMFVKSYLCNLHLFVINHSIPLFKTLLQIRTMLEYYITDDMLVVIIDNKKCVRAHYV